MTLRSRLPHLIVPLFGGAFALAWIAIAADYTRGANRAKTLESEPPFADDAPDVPSLSVVVAACNEEAKLPDAFRSLLAQDYPGAFQIVAVDDRSTDGTGALLDALATEAPANVSVAIVHLTTLPSGWLGKNHALYQGAGRATGEYLLFTDADIRFAPDSLSRALHFAQRESLDHLSSFFRLELRGFWETVFGLGFSFLFFLRFRPWRVRDPQSDAYLGIGGFNLVRRAAYDAIGGHRAIALEVADDMELGRRLKQGGFVSDVIGSAHHIVVRWQDDGLRGLMNGLTKNAYAGLDYSPAVLAASVFALAFGILLPWTALFATRDRRARVGFGGAMLAMTAIGARHARAGGIPAAYALTLPLSTLLLIAVMFRSAWITERQGGITWRGTFYSLSELREKATPAQE